MEEQSIEELFEDFEGNPEDFKVDELDWGESAGKEYW